MLYNLTFDRNQRIEFTHLGKMKRTRSVRWLVLLVCVFADIDLKIMSISNLKIRKLNFYNFIKRFFVKDQNVPVHVFLMFLFLGQMILNAFVNIPTLNMILFQRNVQKGCVVAIDFLQLGPVHVEVNLEIIQQFLKLVMYEIHNIKKRKESLQENQ